MGGLCHLTLGCVCAMINIIQRTDTRCSRGRLERILNYTRVEFLGNLQGVLRAGAKGRAEIYTDAHRALRKRPCGFTARVSIPGWLCCHWLCFFIINELVFCWQLLQIPQLGL